MQPNLSARDSPAGATEPKFVVVHGGARDSYQVAMALSERGMLRALVTDLFVTPAWWLRWQRRLPARLSSPLLQVLRSRRADTLPGERVTLCAWTGLLAVVLERNARVPFAWKRAARRLSDHVLGHTAGKLARRTHSSLLAYSYFAASAFRAYGKPALLFQVHPHPLTVRAILREELALHPECAASLEKEWELSLPERELGKLVEESHAAQAYVVASSFTRQSLVDHGIPAHRIQVVPYGIDLQHFRPAERQASQTLRLLFVGRINQRKGLAYLLAALQQLQDVDVHLSICGRVVDDLSLFAPFQERVTIRPSVSTAELLEAYQQHDLFVFPSVAEGFGQVLLEALACGLPILSTTHTAAPDLIEDGAQGWIVEPRRPDQLAERIRWAAQHPEQLRAMGLAARACAEQFPWSRFRAGVAAFAQQHAQSAEQAKAVEAKSLVPA